MPQPRLGVVLMPRQRPLFVTATERISHLGWQAWRSAAGFDPSLSLANG